MDIKPGDGVFDNYVFSDIKRGSTSKTLLIALPGMIVVVFVCFLMASTITKSYQKNVESRLAYMSNSLVQPLWNLNLKDIQIQANTMLQDDLVLSVEIIDDRNNILFAETERLSEHSEQHILPIFFDNLKIGEMTVVLSRENLVQRIRLTMAIVVVSGVALILILYWVTRLREEVEQRKRYQSALSKSIQQAKAANKAKSVFLANMSHELRTPLNAILGFSNMLEKDPNMDNAQLEKLNIINRSGAHLLSMINSVLELSRIEAGRTEVDKITFNLSELLQEIVSIFELRAKAVGLAFEYHIEPVLNRNINSDLGKVRQIIINLLENAIKFTLAGKVILNAKSHTVEGDQDQQKLLIEVMDTGIGIDKDKLPEIFDPFIQLNSNSSTAKGTGLGLAITKSFVELLNGTISVESELGKGASFQVTIPVVTAKITDATEDNRYTQEVKSLSDGQPNWRILIAEDNSDNALLLSGLLTDVGFDVKVAVNGYEAVELFKAWRPHFIWMDMRMPVMDGYEASEKIRSLPGGAEVKIVALTASAFREQTQSMINAGCDAVMHKPIDLDEIYQMLEQQLGVRYTYQQKDIKARHYHPTSKDLDSIPAPLKAYLRDSAKTLDQDDFKTALVPLYDINPELAEYFAMLANGFRFDAVLELLSPMEETSP